MWLVFVGLAVVGHGLFRGRCGDEFNRRAVLYCEGHRLDYAVSYSRADPMDNIAGLNLGQVMIAEKLPFHLAETYGSDADKVQAKVNRLRFDWADFDPKTCQVTSH